MKKLVMLVGLVLFLTTTGNAFNNAPTLKDNNPENEKSKAEKTKKAKVFLWKVKTEYGFAKGTAPTLEKAKRMISLLDETDVSYTEIIESGYVKLKK